MADSKKRSSSKSRSDRRNYFLMTYAPKAVIDEALKFHRDEIKAYAYIYHNKFSEAEGDEEPHYHILIRLWQPRSKATIIKWFWCVDDNGPINTFSKECGSVPVCYDYLIHKHDPDKYQYSPSDRVVSDRKWFEISDFVDADPAFLAYQMALCDVNPYVIAKRLGRDFIYHQRDVYELRDRTLEHACRSPGEREWLKEIVFEILKDDDQLKF